MLRIFETRDYFRAIRASFWFEAETREARAAFVLQMRYSTEGGRQEICHLYILKRVHQRYHSTAAIADRNIDIIKIFKLLL